MIAKYSVVALATSLAITLAGLAYRILGGGPVWAADTLIGYPFQYLVYRSHNPFIRAFPSPHYSFYPFQFLLDVAFYFAFGELAIAVSSLVPHRYPAYLPSVSALQRLGADRCSSRSLRNRG